jgi:hypothetical protein
VRFDLALARGIRRSGGRRGPAPFCSQPKEDEMPRILVIILTLALTGTLVNEAWAASLRGSAASMVEQNRVAKDHGLSFYRTPDEIRQGVARGELTELSGNADYEVADFVRFAYLQPAVHLFVERLAAQYREACGQKLVVTSAVRPSNGQPVNSHRLSVHPAGMAVDLRVSDRAACRDWLENALLNLERRGVLNGIREFHPPHYHVAVYPEQYLAYAEQRIAAEAEAREAELAAQREAEELARAAEIVPAGASSFVAAERIPVAEAEDRSVPTAAVAMLLVLPFGLGLLIRRWRGRKVA